MKRIFAVAMVLIIACVGMASAAYLPNSTNETQTISTLTTVQCDGVMFESEEYVNSISNMNTPLDPPLMEGEVVSLNSFNQQVLSSGETNYVKAFTADTRDMDANTNNMDTLTLASNEGGKMVFQESVMVESIGSTNTKKSPAQICPFEKQTTTVYSPECERVVGSTNAVITDGAIGTSAGTRTIGDDFNVPMSLNYDVAAAGTGSITITFDVNALEGRGNGEVGKKTTVPAKYVPSEFEFVPGVIDYTPSEMTLDPSEFDYTPSSYTEEYWTTKCCIPKLVPSTYTPEEVSYTPENIQYTPSTMCYTPGGYTYTPSVYIPEHTITMPVKGPSATIEYHEKTTAIGTFTVTKSMSYVSGNNR